MQGLREWGDGPAARFAVVVNPQAPAPMKAALLAATLLMASTAGAQTPAPAADQEIRQLFTALEQSGCTFSRNGTWYSAAQASEHLQRKYDYLLKKDLVRSTESFIELAATQSSVSGQPYQVRCGTAPAVSSQAWFSGQLDALRGGSRR